MRVPSSNLLQTQRNRICLAYHRAYLGHYEFYQTPYPRRCAFDHVTLGSRGIVIGRGYVCEYNVPEPVHEISNNVVCATNKA